MPNFQFGQKNLADVNQITQALAQAGENYFRNQHQLMAVQQDMAAKEGASKMLQAYQTMKLGTPVKGENGEVSFKAPKPEELLQIRAQMASVAPKLGKYGMDAFKLIGDDVDKTVAHQDRVAGRTVAKPTKVESVVLGADGQPAVSVIGGRKALTYKDNLGGMRTQFLPNDAKVGGDSSSADQRTKERNADSAHRQEQAAWGRVKASQGKNFDPSKHIAEGTIPMVKSPVYGTDGKIMMDGDKPIMKDVPDKAWLDWRAKDQAKQTAFEQAGRQITPTDILAAQNMQSRVANTTPAPKVPTVEESRQAFGLMLPDVPVPKKFSRVKELPNATIKFH